jgi:hypothetical protein
VRLGELHKKKVKASELFNLDQMISRKKDIQSTSKNDFDPRMTTQLGFLEPLEWNEEVKNDFSISRLGGLPVFTQQKAFINLETDLAN